jgi:hypothetical protein
VGNAVKGSARAGHVRDNWGFASLVVYTALSVFFSVARHSAIFPIFTLAQDPTLRKQCGF